MHDRLAAEVPELEIGRGAESGAAVGGDRPLALDAELTEAGGQLVRREEAAVGPDVLRRRCRDRAGNMPRNRVDRLDFSRARKAMYRNEKATTVTMNKIASAARSAGRFQGRMDRIHKIGSFIQRILFILSEFEEAMR